MTTFPSLGVDVRSAVFRLGLLILAVLAILSYLAVGRAYYGGYRVPQGSGMYTLLPEELAHIVLFGSFGILAVGALAGALAGTSLPAAVEALARRLALRPWRVVAALAIGAMLVSGGVGLLVLGSAVVTDDEHTYRFIAQTLRTGSLTAPSPGADLPFFREQFVVLDASVRYGKYPIGFPLLLAGGQAMHLEGWTVPLMTGWLVVLTYVLAAPRFGRLTALAATALVASSPQVLLTGGTYLSQPASALCMLSGLAVLLPGLEAAPAGSHLRRLAIAGALFGYGIFVRPLPGVLFTAVAGLAVASVRGQGTGRRLAALTAFGIPASLGLGLILVQNHQQSGDWLTSGYQTFHATGAGPKGMAALVGGSLASVAMSLVSAALRLSVWAVGWPLAPLIGLAAWRYPRTGVFWSICGAALAYRVASPKVGVAPTGPVYMFEVVPVVAILMALGSAWIVRRVASSREVVAVFVAGLVVNVTMFLPGRLEDLGRMGRAQRVPYQMLENHGIRRAVVFHAGVVPWWTRLSWAYYPRHNSPSLDDDVLFLHVGDPRDLPSALELSRSRFRDRPAFWFAYTPDGTPRLLPLEAALGERPRAGMPGP